MQDPKELQKKLEELQRRQKQLAKQLAETKRKRRTRALILFAEQIISETVRKEKAEELFALKIQDAKGEDYTEDFQEEVQRIQSKIQGQKPETQEQNQNQEGENHDFFASVENQRSFTENQNADL